MFAHNLESSDWAEQIPGLDHDLVSSASFDYIAYPEKDCPPFHLIQRLTTVPRGGQSASELRHDEIDTVDQISSGHEGSYGLLQ